jgi:alpha-glucosidase
VDVDGRDPERAPIPWRPPSAAGPGAGFTRGEPWLPLVAEAETLNAETQAADPRSTLSLVRRLAALRARTPALQDGAQLPHDAGRDVLAWIRERDGDRWLAALNFATEPASFAIDARAATLAVSTDPDRPEGPVDPGAIGLGGSEAVLLRLG